jgi:hypothetical protein
VFTSRLRRIGRKGARAVELSAAISAWGTARVGSRVIIGGSIIGGTGPTPAGDVGGRTYLSEDNASCIRQDGYIRKARVYWASHRGVGNWKLKIFRKNGATFDFIGESQGVSFAVGGSIQTFELTTPIEVQIGDYIGLYIPPSGTSYSQASDVTGQHLRYLSGDISSTNDFSDGTDLGNYRLLAEVQGESPFIVCAGDSLIEGHNIHTSDQSLRWHGWRHPNAVVGNPAAEPFNILRSLVPALDYQNMAVGGSHYGNVTFAPLLADITALNPRALLLHCGINDAVLNRTWATIEADLNTIKAGIPSTTKMILTQILPSGSAALFDPQMEDVTEHNTVNFPAWCAANDAHLIECHDAMGQLRVSTGGLDNLKTEYDVGDQVHLSEAGVAAFAALIRTGLQGTGW